MKAVWMIIRWVVGLLFIFSGLVKANDPLGLSYKMQEFFEVWNLHQFNEYTLALSIAMIGFEIIAGVAVIVGWQMRLFSWLLLLLIVFFTLLTGYAVISGKIKECGCFGNCIPLTAMQSFIKDLVLTGLILLLFSQRNKFKPLFSTMNNVLVLFFSAVFSFSFMWYTLLHLPVVDCLPYKEGVNILGGMKIPPGAKPDSTVITFVYKNKGKEIEFTADKFPEDFNDTTYEFVRRYDKLIRQGDAVPAIKDFSLTNQQGQPATETILNAEGYKVLFFLRENYNQGDWIPKAEKLIYESSHQGGIPGVLITSVPLQELYEKPPGLFYQVAPFTCDATAIKTAARANPTIFLMNKDTIVKKWSYADIDDAIRTIRKIYKQY